MSALVKALPEHLRADAELFENLFRLQSWADIDRGRRRFEIRYSTPRAVGVTQWTGGWKVKAWSTRWRRRNQPLWYGGYNLSSAVTKALKAALLSRGEG